MKKLLIDTMLIDKQHKANCLFGLTVVSELLGAFRFVPLCLAAKIGIDCVRECLKIQILFS